MVLKERLNIFGIVGCMLCIVGSITIVLHAPEEQEITSLLQVWRLALQPGETALSTQLVMTCMEAALSCVLQQQHLIPLGLSARSLCQQEDGLKTDLWRAGHRWRQLLETTQNDVRSLRGF